MDIDMINVDYVQLKEMYQTGLEDHLREAEEVADKLHLPVRFISPENNRPVLVFPVKQAGNGK